MKKILFLAILLVCAKHGLCQNADIEKLKQLNADFTKSFVTRDTATMDNIFADNMELVAPDGSIHHKKELQQMLISPDVEYLSAKVDTVSVRLFGNIGLVNARCTGVAKTAQGQNTMQTCYLDVYEKRKGQWRCVASQVALLSVK